MFMKGLTKFSEDYFLKYRTTPVKIRPFDPKQREIGKKYIQWLEKITGNLGTEVALRGSSLFGIAGKGEVEVGIYANDKNWNKVIDQIKKEFGKPENVEENYVRFNDKDGEIEVEIILLKDHEAEVDKKLHQFLVNHPNLLKEYEEVKRKYCYSKREYQRQKSEFLNRVTEMILE